MHLWLGFAVAALVLWGVTGVTQKLSTNRISSERSFLWFCWAMVAISAAVFLFAKPHWGLGRLVVVCSVAGGALNGLGAWTSFRALESGGKASIVISLISLYPLLTVCWQCCFWVSASPGCRLPAQSLPSPPRFCFR